MRVIIVGAGLSGLACAHGLIGLGIDVAVYERDAAADSRPQGYRIQLDPPGLNGLKRCLPEQVYRLCLNAAGAPELPPRVLDSRLRPVAERARMVQSYSPQTRAYAFDRATLRANMIEHLPVPVSFGKQFTALETRSDGRITVHFADGDHDVADLLVGADGVGSAVRGTVLPDARVDDAGMRLIYGKIPASAANALPDWVFEAIFTVATGPGHAHVGVGPVIPGDRPKQSTQRPSSSADYVACLVGAPATHPSMRPFEELRALRGRDLARLARDLIGPDWHPDIHQVLDHWEPDSLFPLRIASAAPIDGWNTPGVTLLGDAVHAMSPVLAMGANTALRDAGELTNLLGIALADNSPVHEAVAEYQRRMLAYAIPLVEASRRIGRERVGQH
ncbi:FAD-dependent oxidoreductase [Nocardia sp. NBC_00511]|uniref:FAD-dependent oxidoreductase n=1 Tax=Nocardia sp. NBC_00511 TaxID=2903591 RepID=UPI0030E09F11